jgi:hypothetical protein
MIGRARHLPDDRLLECYFADRADQTLDPPAADHLTVCSACGTRYAELVDFMNGVRAEGDAEADEIFTPHLLRQQHDQILRRIEHLNRSARVISFPAGMRRHMSAGTGRVAPRWLAAAAAAGLLVGAAVGSTFLRPGARPTLTTMRVGSGEAEPPRVTAPPAVRVSSPSPLVADTLDDDVFLMELELALERPYTQELQPFDALTPHIQEIDSVLR